MGDNDVDLGLSAATWNTDLHYRTCQSFVRNLSCLENFHNFVVDVCRYLLEVLVGQLVVVVVRLPVAVTTVLPRV